jgi:hypothetical protein
MRIELMASAIVCLQLFSGCDLALTETLAPSELETTERGAFTSDGRLFVIGTRAQGRTDAGSWIVEVTRASDGAYVASNYLFGALEGTSGGSLEGAAAGDACGFSGMTVRGMRLYAACVAPDGRAALLEVDVSAGKVRAGRFTTCNSEPSALPCEDVVFYPNGMAVDAAGRIYLSNTQAHLMALGDSPSISVEGSRSLTQVVLGPASDDAGLLQFTHRDWYTTDIVRDGLAPNGVQIEGDQLYYAAGANIVRIPIGEDGSGGEPSVHYLGPALSYIDDFAVRDGRMAVARTLPPALVALDRAPALGTARELGEFAMSLTSIPSSITYQADVPAGMSLFPPGSLIVTAYFGGGLYVLSGLE